MSNTVYRVINVDENDIESEQMLVKMTPVAPGEVDIIVENDGTLTITGKEVTVDDDDDGDDAPVTTATDNGKYRLEPEDGMFRLYATRDIRSDVPAGTRGGLVGGDNVLSRKGNCWVFPDAKVSARAQVNKDAAIMSGCDIGDGVTVTGHAMLAYTQASGDITVEGSAYIVESRLSATYGGELHIRGFSNIVDSVVEVDCSMVISGCNVREAHIRNQFELLSAHHNEWGFLSAYRNKGGVWQFSIGCKVRHGSQAMREMAVDMVEYGDGPTSLHLQMLDHFLKMVEVSSRGWVGYTPLAPAEEPKSATSDDDDTGEVPVMQDFSEMAQRARAAALGMNPPPAVRRAQMDQYGTEL